MSTIPRLLQLPRELRDEIYYYLMDAAGYNYNSITGKLRAADDKPIDLALMLVYKDITTEVKELFKYKEP
ncbi:hypothetical protein CFE70_003106 [Pyrenophora teres f. teres 0-1]|nr:hypothetical protein HRS9139_00985 [Pyrenophora teres f. teres]CAA9959657.1 hypothetical protein PTMSG1_03073 [Pyrenophora teres f. maculata]KAE8848558.1 hypothetical protein PTNB85_02401 [Pyrenophora teres f. teres]KAE8853275.1 hypothetical protein HRS9122_00267 [Pyrenophora teres f. teres]KAE8868483.1 hypothetical protein PTNB29_02394 [Pyrenophora teres f. teres]